MTKKPEAAIITCIDFRLHGKKNIFMELFEKESDFDLITRAGGIKDLVRPRKEEFKESLLRDIDVSINLHKINKLFLVNHQDCGAYKEFRSTKQETKINS